MNKALLPLLLASSMCAAQEYTIEKHKPYGSNSNETFVVKEKKKAGKLTPYQIFRQGTPYTHIYVHDSEYVVIIPYEGLPCQDMRQKVLKDLISKLPPGANVDKELAYLDIECVTLRSKMDPLQINGYTRKLGFTLTLENELTIERDPGWWQCHSRKPPLGGTFNCLTTKQLYK